MSIREAAAAIRATRGTNRPEAAQAIGALTTALEGIGDVLTQLDAAAETTTDYLNHIAGSENTGTKPRSTPDQVEQLRAELPPPLKGRNTGRETHGKWFAEGVPPRALVSGEDAISMLAARYLAQVGRRDAAVRAHVEVK